MFISSCIPEYRCTCPALLAPHLLPSAFSFYVHLSDHLRPGFYPHQPKQSQEVERNTHGTNGCLPRQNHNFILNRFLSVFGRMVLSQQNGSCHDPWRLSTNKWQQGRIQPAGMIRRSHNWATEMGDPNDVPCNGPQNAKPNSFFASPELITFEGGQLWNISTILGGL